MTTINTTTTATGHAVVAICGDAYVQKWTSFGLKDVVAVKEVWFYVLEKPSRACYLINYNFYIYQFLCFRDFYRIPIKPSYLFFRTIKKGFAWKNKYKLM